MRTIRDQIDENFAPVKDWVYSTLHGYEALKQEFAAKDALCESLQHTVSRLQNHCDQERTALSEVQWQYDRLQEDHAGMVREMDQLKTTLSQDQTFKSRVLASLMKRSSSSNPHTAHTAHTATQRTQGRLRVQTRSLPLPTTRAHAHTAVARASHTSTHTQGNSPTSHATTYALAQRQDSAPVYDIGRCARMDAQTSATQHKEQAQQEGQGLSLDYSHGGHEYEYENGHEAVYSSSAGIRTAATTAVDYCQYSNNNTSGDYSEYCVNVYDGLQHPAQQQHESEGDSEGEGMHHGAYEHVEETAAQARSPPAPAHTLATTPPPPPPPPPRSATKAVAVDLYDNMDAGRTTPDQLTPATRPFTENNVYDAVAVPNASRDAARYTPACSTPHGIDGIAHATPNGIHTGLWSPGTVHYRHADATRATVTATAASCTNPASNASPPTPRQRRKSSMPPKDATSHYETPHASVQHRTHTRPQRSTTSSVVSEASASLDSASLDTDSSTADSMPPTQTASSSDCTKPLQTDNIYESIADLELELPAICLAGNTSRAEASEGSPESRMRIAPPNPNMPSPRRKKLPGVRRNNAMVLQRRALAIEPMRPRRWTAGQETLAQYRQASDHNSSHGHSQTVGDTAAPGGKPRSSSLSEVQILGECTNRQHPLKVTGVRPHQRNVPPSLSCTAQPHPKLLPYHTRPLHSITQPQPQLHSTTQAVHNATVCSNVYSFEGRQMDRVNLVNLAAPAPAHALANHSLSQTGLANLAAC